MMKKTILLPLCLALLLTLVACAGSGAQPAETKAGSRPAETAAGTQSVPQSAGNMPTALNQTEYILYQNIFFNGMADDHVGKTVTKEGTLARLYDAFNTNLQ